MAALTFGNVHGVYAPGNVQAEARAPQGDPGRPAGQVRHGREAARPRLPRRFGSTDEEIADGGRERRREDEHRHRHPVRLHALGRRLHVLELRGRAQGRRRASATRSSYDPRAWGKVAESAMAVRVGESTRQLGSARAVDQAPRFRMPDSDAAGNPDDPAERPARGPRSLTRVGRRASAPAVRRVRARGLDVAAAGGRDHVRPCAAAAQRRRHRARRERTVRAIRRRQATRPARRPRRHDPVAPGRRARRLARDLRAAGDAAVDPAAAHAGGHRHLHSGPRDPGLVLAGSIVQIVSR